MKNKKILITTLLLALFSLSSAWAAAPERKKEIVWTTYKKGVTMAEQQDKKIFLYFHADWCTYCKKMELTTFKDQGIIDYLNENYIAITVDSDKEKKIASRFGVRGLPTTWFLKSDMNKLSSMPGYIDSNRLLTILKFINTESYEKMSYQDFKKNL
ncbi:thioredoxin family protein [Desulfocicer niacini]